MADIYSSDMKFKKTDTLLEDGGWVGALVNAAKSFGKAAASNPVTAVAGNLAAYDGFFNNGEGLKTAAVNIQNTVMGLAPDILPTLSNIATGLFESADPQVKRERNRVLKLDQRVKKLFYTASMKKYIKQECNRLLAEYKKKDPAATKQVIDGINQASKKLAGKKEQEVKKKVTKYREATMNIDGFDILVFGTTKDISRVAVVFFSPARKNPILRTIKIPTMQDLKAAKESVELVSEGANAEALFRNEVAICESVLREYNEGVVTEGLTDRIKQLGEQAWTSLKEMIKYLRSLLSGLWEKIRGSKKAADKVVQDAGPAKAKERTIHVDYLTLDAFAGSSAYTPFFEAFRSIHAQIKKYSTAKTVDEKEKFRERIEKNQHQIMAIMRKGASYNHDFSLVEVAKAMETLGKLVQIVEAQIGIFQDLEDEMKRDAKPIGFQATAPDAYSFEAAKQTLSLYMDFYAKLRADAEKLASLLAQASGEATQESFVVIENYITTIDEARHTIATEGFGEVLSKAKRAALDALDALIEKAKKYGRKLIDLIDAIMARIHGKKAFDCEVELAFDYDKKDFQLWLNKLTAAIYRVGAVSEMKALEELPKEIDEANDIYSIFIDIDESDEGRKFKRVQSTRLEKWLATAKTALKNFESQSVEKFYKYKEKIEKDAKAAESRNMSSMFSDSLEFATVVGRAFNRFLRIMEYDISNMSKVLSFGNKTFNGDNTTSGEKQTSKKASIDDREDAEPFRKAVASKDWGTVKAVLHSAIVLTTGNPPDFSLADEYMEYAKTHGFKFDQDDDEGYETDKSKWTKQYESLQLARLMIILSEKRWNHCKEVIKYRKSKG